MRIVTAKGKTFTALWGGVANIDGTLRMSLIDTSFNEVFPVFNNAEETNTINVFVDDKGGAPKEYKGYKKLQSISDKQGNIVVSLRKGE